MTDVKELIKQKNDLLRKVEKEQNVAIKVEMQKQLELLEAEIYKNTPAKATTPPTVDKKEVQKAEKKAAEEKKKADAKVAEEKKKALLKAKEEKLKLDQKMAEEAASINERLLKKFTDKKVCRSVLSKCYHAMK